MFTSKYFNMGKLTASRSVFDHMKRSERFSLEVDLSLQRYAIKDWGILSDEDKQLNDEALNYPEDLYLLAAYQTCLGKIYIITNRISESAGDNATTICFPEER